MSKTVTIIEEDIPEETREEILENMNEPEPVVEICQEVKQPATKQKIRNLIQCTLCGKYVTKKTLSYSHKKSCPALPENQNKPKPEKAEPKEVIKEVVQEEPEHTVYQQEPPYQPSHQEPQIPYYQRMRMERRQLHNERIRLLSQFIA